MTEKKLFETPTSSEKFLNPENCSLEEMLKPKGKLIYAPRKFDITILKKLALLGNQFSASEMSKINILDVGGGHGFLDKLLADEFNRDKTRSLIVDMDIDQEELKSAQENYRGTEGLQFVAADAEKEGAQIFKKTFDLIIVSWPRNTLEREAEDDFGCAYTNLIHQNKPSIIVWIGDEVEGDLTAAFNSRDDYEPVAEWRGRHFLEIKRNMTQHGQDPNPKEGSNLFKIYVKKDVSEEQKNKIKQALAEKINGEKYPWEEELEKKFPEESRKISILN